VREAVYESDEVVVRQTVGAGCPLDGETLGGATVKTETGMRVIAVRRGGGEDAWEVQPGPETALSAGDVLIAKGTRDGAGRLASLVGSP
jgi:uncharacterized protein with PhoU and TrkA domain